MEKRRKTSIILNSLIIILELFALIEILFRFLPNDTPFVWYYSLTYYTNLSNIFLLITSIASLICEIRNINNTLLMKLRYASIIAMLVTFITVYFFIIVTKNVKLGFAFRESMWLFTHTICPLLGFLSYVFLDVKEEVKIHDVLYPIAFTTLYTVLIVVIHLCNGRMPYISDFSSEVLKINTLWIALIGFIEVIVTFLLALLLRFISNKVNKKKEDINE